MGIICQPGGGFFLRSLGSQLSAPAGGGETLAHLHALTGGGGNNALLQIGNGGAVAALLLIHIVGVDTSDGVRLVAVHINQALEVVFLVGIEQPVYGPFV